MGKTPGVYYCNPTVIRDYLDGGSFQICLECSPTESVCGRWTHPFWLFLHIFSDVGGEKITNQFYNPISNPWVFLMAPHRGESQVGSSTTPNSFVLQKLVVMVRPWILGFRCEILFREVLDESSVSNRWKSHHVHKGENSSCGPLYPLGIGPIKVDPR